VGGRPLYHEYPGVGHNCWDLTYAMPELYEWLLGACLTIHIDVVRTYDVQAESIRT